MDAANTINYYWFRALDNPIRDETPFRTVSSSVEKKAPTVWKIFSPTDTKLMEQAFLDCHESNPKTCPTKDSNNATVIPIELDGLFECNVISKEIYPIYWEGPVFQTRRGIWFENHRNMYIPVEENLTLQIEDGYRKFQSLSSAISKDIAEFRWPLLGPHLGFFVSFDTSGSICWIQAESITSKLARSLLQIPGTRLVRGWDAVKAIMEKKPPVSNDPSMADLDAETPLPIEEPTEMRRIDHLVLVVHGIGQKYSDTTGAGLTFVKDCDVFRNGLDDAETFLNSNATSQLPEKVGIQVIPVHWRQKLKVNHVLRDEASSETEKKGLLEPQIQLSDITPEGISGVRSIINDVILDVLLYMTPKYRQEMISHVSEEMNRIYRLFLKKNPSFTGKVSLYGHSLGSVISLDIATHQCSFLADKASSSKASTPGIDISDLLGGSDPVTPNEGFVKEIQPLKAEKLDFEINQLFAVGSPIGMFLFLAGTTLRPLTENADHKLPQPITARVIKPAVKGFFNIYHSYDPVAFRIEPAISSLLSNLRPNPIPYTKGGLTKTVKGVNEQLQRGRDYLTGLYTSAENMIGTISSKIGPTSPDPAPEIVEMDNFPSEITTEERGSSMTENRRSSVTKPGPVVKQQLKLNPSIPQQEIIEGIKVLNPAGRIDWVLQESILENPYLSSLSIHLNYWGDQDVNALIIKALYGL